MKAKRIGIFYWSTRESRDRWPVWTESFGHNDDDCAGWIRVEVAKSNNLLDALHEAKPRRGESVMNTHWIV